MSADGDIVREARGWGDKWLGNDLSDAFFGPELRKGANRLLTVCDIADRALARLEAAADERDAARQAARAEGERADVMQHERDWEHDVVNLDLWNRLQAAEAQRDALAEALRFYADEERYRWSEGAPASRGIIQSEDRGARARVALAEAGME